jgi:peptidoglycan/xylan/chitin deacetylase (PgdA/CDA1 family)
MHIRRIASRIFPGYAAPLAKVALTDRSRWPHALRSDRAFDLASRAEIASFVEAMTDLDRSHSAAIPGILQGDTPDLTSLGRWKARTHQTLLTNFAMASRSCTGTSEPLCPEAALAGWDHLVTFIRATLPNLPHELAAWRTEAQAFHRDYLREQVRLAALFPKVTSEILPLANSEILGDGFEDKNFLLTFDDGPSREGGSTDQTIELLRKQRLNGTFFILGTNLAARRARTLDEKLRSLYTGMCVGSHGMEHRPHAQWSEATSSLALLNQQLANIRPADQARIRFFRPPYGERSPEIIRSLDRFKMSSMLWNIDSQDWQTSVTPPLAAGRVLSLMLLWRRGILLFHDTSLKALNALPLVWDSVDGAHVRWIDCHTVEGLPTD